MHGYVAKAHMDTWKHHEGQLLDLLPFLLIPDCSSVLDLRLDGLWSGPCSPCFPTQLRI
jgi:hypothetical protein